jgi:amphi-Trp domain-containing protein
MASSKPARDATRTLERAAFVAQLRRLADALESGRRFEVRVAGARVYVPARAEFSLEHERHDGNEELELQLRWTTGD